MTKIINKPIKKHTKVVIRYRKNIKKTNDLIGEGGQGTLYKGFYNNHPCAIKEYKESFHTQEAQFISRVNHCNVIQLLAHGAGWMAMKIYDSMDLFDYVAKVGNFNELMARYVFSHIVDALDYIHSVGIVHRDIKLENVLIDMETYEPILSDFGLAVDVSQTTIRQGTEGYIAPELSLQMGTIISETNSDIFSLGVLLFAMVMGSLPYMVQLSIQEQLLTIFKNKQWDKFWNVFRSKPSDSFKNLIQGCLTFLPEERYSIKDIRNSDWYGEEIPS